MINQKFKVQAYLPGPSTINQQFSLYIELEIEEDSKGELPDAYFGDIEKNSSLYRRIREVIKNHHPNFEIDKVYPLTDFEDI